MTVFFYNTSVLDGSIYVKIPLRSNAILDNENNENYCFIWSFFASVHPCRNIHHNRVSTYRQKFKEVN